MAKVYISCNFYKPGDVNNEGDIVTQEEVESQYKEDCLSPEFGATEDIKSNFLEIISNRLIPREIQEEYPLFKKFIWDFLERDRKKGIYKDILNFPSLINASTTRFELLPKFVIQYLNNLPTEFLPQNPCEFRKNIDIFSNFLPGTETSIQQLLQLLGIEFLGKIKFHRHIKLTILREEVNDLTPWTNNNDGVATEDISTLRTELLNTGNQHYDPVPNVGDEEYLHSVNDPIWYIDGNTFLGEEFIINELGEIIEMNLENYAFDIDYLIKFGFEISSHLPASYWLEFIQDYGVKADQFVFAKFVLSMIGLLENSNEDLASYGMRKLTINGEMMYDWNFNRLAKDWIPNGYWDFENRNWIGTKDLYKHPPDESKTRRAVSEDEERNFIDKDYCSEIDESLFRWGRNKHNSWKLPNDSIASIFKNEHGLDFSSHKGNFNPYEILENNVIELWINQVIQYHWIFQHLLNIIKIGNQNSPLEFNYNSNFKFLESDYFKNFKNFYVGMSKQDFIDYLDSINPSVPKDLRLDSDWELNKLGISTQNDYDVMTDNWQTHSGFKDYLEMIFKNPNNLELDATWHLAVHYGLYMTGKMILKMAGEFNFDFSLVWINFINKINSNFVFNFKDIVTYLPFNQNINKTGIVINNNNMKAFKIISENTDKQFIIDKIIERTA